VKYSKKCSTTIYNQQIKSCIVVYHGCIQPSLKSTAWRQFLYITYVTFGTVVICKFARKKHDRRAKILSIFQKVSVVARYKMNRISYRTVYDTV
jgi:hypothetical protein